MRLAVQWVFVFAIIVTVTCALSWIRNLNIPWAICKAEELLKILWVCSTVGRALKGYPNKIFELMIKRKWFNQEFKYGM